MRRTWSKLSILALASAALVSGCARPGSSLEASAHIEPTSLSCPEDNLPLQEPQRFSVPKFTAIRPIEEARQEVVGVQAISQDERTQGAPPAELRRRTPGQEAQHRGPQPLPKRRSQDGNLDAVSSKAQQLIRQAYGLADRGALYSARSDLMTALQGLCEATDTRNGDRRCSDALIEGMQALDEAADFVVNGDLRADLKRIVAGHRTSALKDAKLDHLTNIRAMQIYYTFAQEKLIEAGNGTPAASEALSGLGKVTRHLPSDDSGAKRNATVKALVLQQSAVEIWADNYHAKHELGVLYTLLNRPETAKPLLLDVAKTTNWPEAWANLAQVHAQLNEPDLAEKASNEARYAQESIQRNGHVKRGALEFQWVSPEQFASENGEPRPAAVATKPSSYPRR